MPLVSWGYECQKQQYYKTTTIWVPQTQNCFVMSFLLLLVLNLNKVCSMQHELPKDKAKYVVYAVLTFFSSLFKQKPFLSCPCHYDIFNMRVFKIVYEFIYHFRAALFLFKSIILKCCKSSYFHEQNA